MPRSEDGPEDLTIEQLAGVAELPFSTIRLYQHRGLLPPPERRGRVGYYGPDHVARLRLIAELQARGYSLAAIKDLVDTWQHGQTLTGLLGLERRAADVLAGDATEVRLRPDELAARFAGVELTPGAMQRAHELGLIEFDDDVIVVTEPTFLEVGATLALMGVPVDDVLDEYEHLRQAADELAARFGALFDLNLWQPFVAAGMPAAELPGLTEELARLGPLAEQIVSTTLRRALAVIAAQFLDEQAQAMAGGKAAKKRTAPKPSKGAAKGPAKKRSPP